MHGTSQPVMTEHYMARRSQDIAAPTNGEINGYIYTDILLVNTVNRAA